MYNGLVHAHSGLRWIVLILMLIAIFNAASRQNKGSYIKKDKLINLFTMISLHIQLLIGLGLYFMNERGKVAFVDGFMKNTMYRFFAMEHLVAMIIAIALVTIGRKKAEKLIGTRDKHRKILVTYSVALIIILLSIPWPFRTSLGAGWF